MIAPPLEKAVQRFEAGETEGLFLVHGEEDFLVEEAGRGLAARLAPSGGTRETRLIRGGKDEAAVIVSEMSSVSFLSPEILLLVKRSELFGERRERESESFFAWLEKTPRMPHPLVFTAFDGKGERGKVDKRRRLYKAVAKRGATAEFGELKPDEARAWASARFRSLGKNADADAVLLLIERTGVSLGSLANEIEKLALYQGDEKRVDRAVVEALVGPSREDAIWGLTDTVLSGNRARALLDVARLIDRSGEAPLGILLWLAREFRALVEARALLGHPRVANLRLPRDPGAIHSRFVRSLSPEERALFVSEGYSFLGMHPWAASVRLAAAQGFSEARLRDAIVRIARAERLLKTGAGGRDRVVLEETILALAEKESAA